MFNCVWFNTKEKMFKCFNTLILDKSRYAHTFHLVEPKDNRYYVYYISKKVLTYNFKYDIVISE